MDRQDAKARICEGAAVRFELIKCAAAPAGTLLHRARRPARVIAEWGLRAAVVISLRELLESGLCGLGSPLEAKQVLRRTGL